jgi:UDP-N-acetylmuramyl pentapeptide phosphotransferase/UDP-N-acetylglucosamine-1-phosphate transferase
MFYASSGETELSALGFVFFPLFDMARVFTVRISKGKSPFLPDKNHLHHKVLAVTGSHIKTTIVILSFASGLAIMNVILRSSNVHTVILLDFAYAIAVNFLFNKLPKKS